MNPRPKHKPNSGYALIIVLVMGGVALLILAGTISRTMATIRLNERSNLLLATRSAAEGATERVLARMMVDFQEGGQGDVISHLSAYATDIPSSTESPNWSDFTFEDGRGNSARNYVVRTTTNSNPPYVQLQNQYAGLNGWAATYRVVSNAKLADSRYNVVGAVQAEVQMAEIPVFQFAIFYNSLLEFTWAAPLTVRGRVHANGPIFVGSSSPLSFNYLVTGTSTITTQAWGGHTLSQYTGSITYGGTPAPGYQTGVASLTLPIGTNNSAAAVREIINLPPSGEDVTSPMGQQRYYNKADMTILVSNNAVNIRLKNAPDDASPATIQYTNVNNVFLTTNAAFYDQRESKTIRATQLDVGKFKSWMATNSQVQAKFGASASNAINIIYVADYRFTNSSGSSLLSAVRLTNGAVVPTNGLTVATPNPLYVQGDYNCPNSGNLNTTNTSGSSPCSLISDALTVLSSSWSDNKSTNTLANRNKAVSTTLNAAIITGNVNSITNSAGTDSSIFSGGVVNMPRLLEDWGNGGSVTLTLNTSLVSLFNSVWATNVFQNPGVYYYAPTRAFSFDLNYFSPQGMPPGTPSIRRMVRSTWCNPPPGNVTYNP